MLLEEDEAPIPSNAVGGASTTTPSQAAAAALKAAKQAQAQAASTSLEQQGKLKMLLKPPGCRPNTQSELLNYDRQRTLCAQTKPAPSAFTTPPTQTPVEVKLTNIKIIGLLDEDKQFVVEMTRSFKWVDQKAETTDTDMLWNPRMAFTFPDSVKVEGLAPVSFSTDGAKVTVTEELRVTLANPGWDYAHFPFDSRTFEIRMASTLTKVLEPITLRMNEVELPKNLFGFVPSSTLAGSIAMPGNGMGPQGVWGHKQTVVLSATATRRATSSVMRLFVPISLCALIVYAGFFMKIALLQSRITTSVLALLIQFTYMNVLSSTMPGSLRNYLVWADYWIMIQAMLVALACCHHSMCHFLNERYGETKYVHLDMAMRATYPIAYILSFLWAESIVAWKIPGFIFTSASILIIVIVFVAIFAVLERRSAARYEKTHYPGI